MVLSGGANALMNRVLYGTDSLTRKVTVAEAESTFAVSLPKFGASPIAFGYLHPEWLGLKKKMIAGDEIWEFEARSAGRSYRGVKLLRKGKAIDAIVAEVKERAPAGPPKKKTAKSARSRFDPSDFLSSCRVQEGITKLTRMLKSDPKCGFRGLRGVGHLLLGQYDLALADFQRAEEDAACRADGFRQRIGVTHWLAGRMDEAADTWRQLVIDMERGKIQRSDAAKGVGNACLLWFAGVRLSRASYIQLARGFLKNNFKKPYTDSWPGPIGKFLLGGLDAQELGALASNEGKRCKAEFYVGVRALQDGKRRAYRRAMRKAAGYKAPQEGEYFLAAHECK
jgi:hypothetical protein